MSEIPAPKENDPKKMRMLQSSTMVYYLYPKLTHGEVEVYLKGSKLGKSVMVQHVKGKIQTVDAGFYTNLSDDRMIIEKIEHNPLRSKLFKVYSNYMHANIECNAPADRQVFEGKDRKVEFKVVTSGFEIMVHVTFGQHAWNRRKLAPTSSSHKVTPPPTSSSHKVTPPPSTSTSHKVTPPPVSSSVHSSSHSDPNHKVTPPKPVPLNFLITVSCGCAFLLAFMMYCYRRSKLLELKRINDLVSMDETQEMDQTDVSMGDSTVRERMPSEGFEDMSGLG